MTYTITDAQLAMMVALIVWELIWKGLALWRAAKLGQKYWYVVLLVLNTAGVLPILYLIFTSPEDHK